MTVEARWNGVSIAASDNTMLVEGNHYFPPQDVSPTVLEHSDLTTYCTWKGDAHYHHLVVDGQRNENAAWYYPHPYDAASAIRGYIAFWRGVEVIGDNREEPEISPPARSFC